MNEQDAVHRDVWAVQHRADKPALERLCDAFSPLICATAGRYGSRFRADAVQEGWCSFIQAVQWYDEGRGVPFPAFASAKVRGDVRTAMRRIWTHERQTVHAASDQQEGPGLEATTGACDEGMRHAEEWMEVTELINESHLSAKERMVVEFMLAGYAMKDIAHQLGVTLETAKTFKKRALHKMRSALQDFE